MTNRYTDDAATGAGTGADWENAYTAFATTVGVDTAGDLLCIASTHTEDYTAAFALNCAGTLATPSRIVSTAASGAPPTAVVKGAQLNNITTSANFTATGSFYVEGLVIACGVGNNNQTFAVGLSAEGLHAQHWKSCDFKITATGSTMSLSLGPSGDTAGIRKLIFEDVNLLFSHSGQGLYLYSDDFWWKGGGAVGGTTKVNTLFRGCGGSNRSVGPALIEGVDIDALVVATTGTLVTPPGAGQLIIIFANCKLPSGWSSIFSSVPTCPGVRGFVHNCDNADTHYRFQQEEYAGSVYTETTIVKTGGSTDGATPYSFKMVSSANAEYPLIPLCLELPAVWIGTVGSSKTVTVEIVHDTNVAAGQGAGASYAFQNDEIWLEVQYLGNASFPLSSLVNDAPTYCISTPADQASSSVTWTTTGMTTPVKQSLSVTFTPQEVGYFKPKVYLAKASKTVYVDGDAVES